MIKICIKGSCVLVPQWLECKSFAKADPHTSGSERMCIKLNQHGPGVELVFRQKKLPPPEGEGSGGRNNHSGWKSVR